MMSLLMLLASFIMVFEHLLCTGKSEATRFLNGDIPVLQSSLLPLFFPQNFSNSSFSFLRWETKMRKQCGVMVPCKLILVHHHVFLFLFFSFLQIIFCFLNCYWALSCVFHWILKNNNNKKTQNIKIYAVPNIFWDGAAHSELTLPWVKLKSSSLLKCITSYYL